MVATIARVLHELVDVGAPFYAGAMKPGGAGTGQPALHKFDRADFVDRFLAEVAGAAATGDAPDSLLGPLNPGGLDVDTDGLDFLHTRFRKLYQPSHFRFYLAACELRCLVPGFPAPMRKKVKKVEFVIRRVSVKPGSSTAAAVGDTEQAWVTIPAPSQFPGTPGAGTAPIDLAPRLTGNTRTWWPIPQGVTSPEGEERFPMSRVFAKGLEGHSLYFGFLPLVSGEMYGPRASIDDGTNPAHAPILGTRANADDPPKLVPEHLSDYFAPQAPAALPPKALVPVPPLVPAPSNFSLSPASIKGWFKSWQAVLALLSGQSSNGPRPKFESPRTDGDPAHGFAGGWAYVVRCVATLEPAPGCIVEAWGPPTPPALIAPHFDPFAGRPTQIDIPSPGEIAKMLQGLKPNQIARRGGVNTSLKNHGSPLKVDVGTGVSVIVDAGAPREICFLGFPLITIVAYIMFAIGIVILILMFPLSIFLSLKFCLPIGPEE